MRWRSPLRGPWLTSVFGAVLLVALPVVALTGLLSYLAYAPQLGQAIPGNVGWLRPPPLEWPTSPSWAYQLNQGTHVVLGMAVIPLVLAKLWSVTPKLFAWPPVRSIAHALERLSLLLLVGSILFELVTGVLNIQYDYLFGFSFYVAHYYGAWVFIAAFVAHVCLKLPTMVSSLRSRSFRAELRTRLAETRPEPADADGLVAARPDPPTMSRRGALAMVGGGSALLALLTIGQSIGGAFRPLSVLLPRGRVLGDGPNDFQVNRTAAAARISPDDTGDAWRLRLSGGPDDVVVDRAQLLAMPQHTADLPIACVEGWSTTQTWTGVRLADLAGLAGVGEPSSARVESLQKSGAFRAASLQRNQVLAPDSLLALRVNDADLSDDHGFPARIIVPAMPGVHNTKWVRSIEFRS